MACVPLPTRDYSVLDQRTLKLIKKRSKPPKPDYEAIAAREKREETHKHMRTVVGGWRNTIAQNRIDRQTRLKNEAEAEERRKQLIDEEEKKIQKLKRAAALAEARKAEFAQRPEVRDVNSQLLVHEVQLENEQIQAFKERKKIEEMKKQIKFDEEYNERYRKMVENENRIRRERREKAIRVAAEFKRQKEEKEERLEREKEENMKDEILIAQQMKLELEKEQEAIAERKRLTRQHIMETMQQNQFMMKYKDKMKEVEREEDRRLRALQEKTMDEQDERRAAEAKRRQDKLDAQQKLIDAEARRQMATKKVQQDFLEKQQREQYEKESKEIAALSARRNKFVEERRRDYLEAMAQKEAAAKAKRDRQKNKRRFPNMAEQEEDRLIRRRYEERRQMDRDLRAFQLQQAEEKRERERAEAERTKLEFKKMIDDDLDDLERVKEYARTLLRKAQEDDTDDMAYYNY